MTQSASETPGRRTQRLQNTGSWLVKLPLEASAAKAMSAMEWSGILYVVLPLAAALVLVLIMYPVKPKAREAPRPVWHYLLLWPLIVDMGARQANPGRIARTFKVIGRVIVAALMIVAMVFAVWARQLLFRKLAMRW